MIHKIYGRLELLDPGAVGISPPRARVYDENGQLVGEFVLPRKQLWKWQRYVEKEHLLLVLDFEKMKILQVQSVRFKHFIPVVRALLQEINKEKRYRLWFDFANSERQMLDSHVKLWRIPFSTHKDEPATTALTFVYREDGKHSLRAYITIHTEDISRVDILIPLRRLRHWAKSPEKKLREYLVQAYDYLVAIQSEEVQRHLIDMACKPICDLVKDSLNEVFIAFRAALPFHPLARDPQRFAQASYFYLCAQIEEALEKTPLVRGMVGKRRRLYRALFVLGERAGKPLQVLTAFLGKDLHAHR